MSLSQPLQGFQSVYNFQKIRLRIIRCISRWHIHYYEISYSATIQLRNVVMTIVTLRLESKKKGLLWKTERAAISENKTYISITVAITSRTYQCGNFFNSIRHYINDILI